MKSRMAFLFLLGCVFYASAQNSLSAGFDGKTWWTHVKVLAADDMEGRETGSPGLARTAAYIVQQAQKDGLQPVGSDGFYQPVKFRSKQIDETQSSLSLVHDGREEPLVLGEDAIL